MRDLLREVHFIYDDEPEEAPKNVTHAEVDASVDDVHMRAFQHCQKLVDVRFPHNLVRLEKQAFQHCVSLQQVELPPPTMKIGIRCFDGCHKLVMADLSECRVWVLMTQCFRNCTSLEFVHMPRTLEVIAHGVFRGCQSLKGISLERTQLKVIGKCALSNCKSLQKVWIPPCTEQVGRRAFAECISLTEAKVPLSLSLDREEVFKNCIKLRRISHYTVHRGSDMRMSEPISDPLPRRDDPRRSVLAATEDASQRSNALAREQVSAFTHALDEAKQENAALSQRLEDVCVKLERYESQWSTIVDQLKSATVDNRNSQNEQERAIQAKEKELEKYKRIVERQNKAIRTMKLKFFEVPESEKRPSTDHQDSASLKHAGGTITRVPFGAALDPDVSLADFVKMMEREQPMEAANLPNADLSSVEQSREGEIRRPVPFIIDDDVLTIDTADFLVTTTQLSQGSDEWQVM